MVHKVDQVESGALCSVYGQNLSSRKEPLGYNKKTKKRRKILSTLDILISVFVVTPLVVACWRGTWQLMDIYPVYFPPWESWLIGTLIQTIMNISQESFNASFNQPKKSLAGKLGAFLFMKLYTVVLNAVTNMQWRGTWILVDRQFGVHSNRVENTRGSICFFGICLLLMFSMRCLRNLNSPPFEVCLDYGDSMFLYPSMFKVKGSEKLILYILDVLFSNFVVATLGIIIWRGFWLWLDVTFFPEDETWTAWGSMILGYVMVAAVFTLQKLMKNLCDILNGISRLLVADAYTMFAVVAVILVWRGIWYLLNLYFLPENEELSCWISSFVPLLILMVMGCSNTVLARGVYLDCEEPDGTCILFPCDYLKAIFDQESRDTWLSIWTAPSGCEPRTTASAVTDLDYHVVTTEDFNLSKDSRIDGGGTVNNVVLD